MINKKNHKMLYLAGIISENQYHEIIEENKKIFVLVGPPAVGKSTWIKNTFQKEKPYIINRDDIVENIASQMGMTYDDMFSAPPKDAIIGSEDEKYGTVIKSPPFMNWQPLSYSKIIEANKIINEKLNERISQAANSGKDIVVDMTNMTANARKQSLKSISGKEHMFRKIAVIFPFQGAEHIIKKIAIKRSQEIKSQGGSKTIPPEVLDRMMNSFQQVSPEEGFDEIIEMDNREKLKQLSSIENI
jgi:predicted kinase